MLEGFFSKKRFISLLSYTSVKCKYIHKANKRVNVASAPKRAREEAVMRRGSRQVEPSTYVEGEWFREMREVKSVYAEIEKKKA